LGYINGHENTIIYDVPAATEISTNCYTFAGVCQIDVESLE